MTGLTADQALEALRCLGLRYRPDLRVPDGAWEAACPACVAYTPKLSLGIAESRRGGRVSLRCRFSRDCQPGQIEEMLRKALRPPLDAYDMLALAEQAQDIAVRALALAAPTPNVELAVAA